jgi:hypothetical protein
MGLFLTSLVSSSFTYEIRSLVPTIELRDTLYSFALLKAGYLRAQDHHPIGCVADQDIAC